MLCFERETEGVNGKLLTTQVIIFVTVLGAYCILSTRYGAGHSPLVYTKKDAEASLYLIETPHVKQRDFTSII